MMELSSLLSPRRGRNQNAASRCIMSLSCMLVISSNNNMMVASFPVSHPNHQVGRRNHQYHVNSCVLLPQLQNKKEEDNLHCLHMGADSTTTPPPASSTPAPKNGSDDENAKQQQQQRQPNRPPPKRVGPSKKYKDVNAFNAAMYDAVRRVEKTGEIEYAFRAESMLYQLVANIGSCADDDDVPPSSSTTPAVVVNPFRPNTQSYNTVVAAWRAATVKLAEGSAVLATNKDGVHHIGGDVYTARDAVHRAERLLEELETRYVSGEYTFCSDLQTYNMLIDAHSKSRVDGQAEESEALLEKMELYSQRGRPNDNNDESDSNNNNNNNNENKPWHWLKPDVVTYNGVMVAYANSRRDGVEKAELFLEKMKQLSNQDKNDEKSTAVTPNARTYNSLINAWAKRTEHSLSNHNDSSSEHEKGRAATRVQELLQELTALYESSGRLEEFRPDVTTYTSVIDCLAKEALQDAPERAERYLAELENMYVNTGDAAFRPNVRTYTAVINAWSRTRHAQAPFRAEEILTKMEQSGGGEGDNSIKPTARTYTVVISCWVRSKEISKPQQSLRILKKVSDLYKETNDAKIRPNVFMYNAVIDACAKCPCDDVPEQQSKSLKIAFAVLKALRMDKVEKPNQITYTLLLRCVNNLMPRISYMSDTDRESRNDILRKLYTRARADGLVEESVLRTLRLAADADLFSSLVGDGEGMVDQKTGWVDYSKVPREWCKNVGKKDR